MKKRINTIDGKILVQGGTDNELKSNEIRVNADKSLTERVDGKIVSAGGSGSGGGLRPATADDVLLMYGVEGPNGDVVEFSNTITTPSFKALYVMSNKPLYAGGNMNYALKNDSSFSPHPDYAYTYQLGYYTTPHGSPITLDLYIQD